MKGLSPTQRTLRVLRQQGAICGITEHWNYYVGIRQDLFGFIDLIALTSDRGIVGMQCCARSGHAAHRKKILENEVAPEWIKSGGKIEIWSWAKQKLERGGKAERWMAKVEEITSDNFNGNN